MILVVGASASGLSVVEALRRNGFAGQIRMVGEEPQLPYDRPPLSKQVLSEEWAPERTTLRDAEDLRSLDVELMLGHRATGLREPHGGTIDMTSEIGHGSTFTVRLPGVAASGSP
jgi:3-phenylpropionate/trans-cinnamate dioxygenase ferredoxin reductase component